MNVSKDYEIQNSILSIDSIYHFDDLEKGLHRPLLFKEPIGHYTLNPKALYAGRQYTLGIRLNNIDLKGKLNFYNLELSHGRLLSAPFYDADLDLIIVTVQFNESVIPTLNELALPEPLWTLCSLHLTINDLTVETTTGDLVTLPVSFNVNGSTISGDGFFNSDKAFMVVQPGERLFLDIISGGAGGAGVNLTKGENKTGNGGGDATLTYIEPETGLIKPIVFLEGGLGGRLSTHAHQDFKERQAKSKVFVDGLINDKILFEVIEIGYNQPSRLLTETTGGACHTSLKDGEYAAGGKGGMKDEIGFRGEGGMSGGRAVLQVQYLLPAENIPGPFIIIHPKTMVNIFGIITDKDLKIKKTKKPMIGGEGGFSLTESGENGFDGNLIVSF